MGLMPNWTMQEKAFLEEHYGEMSITAIAHRLGRSENAVRVMRNRMGLGPFLENGDYVTLNQVFYALYKRNMDSYTFSVWKQHGLPYTKRRVQKNRFKVITIPAFWKWAEKHKGLVSFRLFEPLALGAEPAWVDIKRKHDLIVREHNAKWTAYDDMQLQNMLMKRKYTYTELSDALHRSVAAIRRRIYDLKLGINPVKTKRRFWTEDEKQLLLRMHQAGIGYDAIGKKLDRTGGAVRGMHERLMNPDYHAEYRERKRTEARKKASAWTTAGRMGYRGCG